MIPLAELRTDILGWVSVVKPKILTSLDSFMMCNHYPFKKIQANNRLNFSSLY